MLSVIPHNFISYYLKSVAFLNDVKEIIDIAEDLFGCQEFSVDNVYEDPSKHNFNYVVDEDWLATDTSALNAMMNMWCMHMLCTLLWLIYLRTILSINMAVIMKEVNLETVLIVKLDGADKHLINLNGCLRLLCFFFFFALFYNVCVFSGLY